MSPKKEPGFKIPADFCRWVGELQVQMGSGRAQAIGALGAILEQLQIMKHDRASRAHLTFWAGLEATRAGLFGGALISSGFAVLAPESGLLRIPMMTDRLERTRALHQRASNGGKKSRGAQASAPPDGEADGRPNAPPDSEAETRPDSSSNSSTTSSSNRSSKSAENGEALSCGGEGDSLVPSSQSQNSADNSEPSDSSAFDAAENSSNHPSAGARAIPEADDDAPMRDEPLELVDVRRPLAAKAARAIASRAAGEIRKRLFVSSVKATAKYPEAAADWTDEECDAWAEKQMRALLAPNTVALLVDRFGEAEACLELRRQFGAFLKSWPGHDRAAVETTFESQLYRRFERRLYVEVERDRAAKGKRA